MPRKDSNALDNQLCRRYRAPVYKIHVWLLFHCDVDRPVTDVAVKIKYFEFKNLGFVYTDLIRIEY
jgi:hypothetical protein